MSNNTFNRTVHCLCLLMALVVCSEATLLSAQDAAGDEVLLAKAKKKKKKKQANSKPAPAVTQSANAHIIDLPAVLRLAGAQNIDVLIAREQLTEANAKNDIARQRFFPWIMPGFAYRRHDGQIQAVDGQMFTASKQSYTVGANVAAQWDLGDAIYAQLAEKQRAQAADSHVSAVQQANVYQAVQDYYELVKAGAQAGVAQESIRVAEDYAKQINGAVKAGVAFKGDELRVQVQTERYRISLRQAREKQRIASARLAQTLKLDATVELAAAETGLSTLTLLPENSALDSLVTQALNSRPELKQQDSLIAAAKAEKKGTTIGPLIPTVGAQMYLGGLGGGFNDQWGNFKDTQDYQLLFGWKIGPGGLFDRARQRASQSRLKQAELSSEKTHDEVVRQVVEQHTRVDSLRDQMATAQKALQLAEQTVKLTRERKAFGVGVVLENIQAEQELNRVRNEYLETMAEYNKAQYGLARAVGKISP